MADVSDSEKTSQKASTASLDKTDQEFALKLHKDSNTVASKIQIYFSLHNATCFKFGAAVTRKC